MLLGKIMFITLRELGQGGCLVSRINYLHLQYVVVRFSSKCVNGVCYKVTKTFLDTVLSYNSRGILKLSNYQYVLDQGFPFLLKILGLM